METKTIDSIVREILMELKLGLHHYVRFLLYVLRELEHQSKKHKFFAKRVELTVNSYNRVTIPSEARSIIDVSIREGERLQSLFSDESINKLYNVGGSGQPTLGESDTAIAWPEADDTTIGTIYYYDAYGSLKLSRLGTPWYGLSGSRDYAFTVDNLNNEIVFSNKFDETKKVVVTYQASPVSTSVANVVNHKFVDTLKESAKLQHIKTSSPARIADIQFQQQSYKNARRELQAFLYPMTMAKLVNFTRKGIHAGTKN